MADKDFTQPTPPGTSPADDANQQRREGLLARGLAYLSGLGLGEYIIRYGTSVLSLLLVVAVIWLMQTFYRQADTSSPSGLPASANAENPLIVTAGGIPYDLAEASIGISRQALLHTNIPSRPRLEVTTYTVETGDTVFGIAEKFGLKPYTILWGNYDTLKDDPHNLRPGQVLNILPTDGTYYEWHSGDGLNGVAEYFGVDPQVIINFPGNNLDANTIGDYSSPNIEPGTWLVIPGGMREFISWSAPVGITRDNPAIASVLGPGACGAVSGGAVGYGTFIWPTDRHYLSGNNYSPESNHRGIDLSGYDGAPIYASDAGVVVYAGWNDWGYGYVIVLDHGRDWQTLYAHLSAINVDCGQSVGQGDVIAAMGSTGNSTGPHLHFELMNTVYGKVNPFNFLPPP